MHTQSRPGTARLRHPRPLRARARRLTLAAAVSAAALGLAGCGSNTPQAGGSTPASTASPSGPTSPITPSASVQPSTAPPSVSLPASPTLADRMLPASNLPGLTAQTHWQEGPTGPANATPYGACEQYDLLTIGARTVLARAYQGQDGTADEQIAKFPDEMTAVRASKVMQTWQSNCQKRVRTVGKNFKVGPLNNISIPSGDGTWYYASWVPQSSAPMHYQAVGMARVGSLVAIITMDQDSHSHTYPTSPEVMEAAVRNAVARLS